MKLAVSLAQLEQTRGPRVPVLTFPERPWMSAFLSTSVSRLRRFFGGRYVLFFLSKQTIRVTLRENWSFRWRLRFSALMAWIFAHVWRPRSNLSTLWLNLTKYPINTVSWREINHYTDPNNELLWAGQDFLRFRVLCVLTKGRDAFVQAAQWLAKRPPYALADWMILLTAKAAGAIWLAVVLSFTVNVTHKFV